MYLSIFIADSVTIDKPIGNPDVILTTTTAEQISMFVNGEGKHRQHPSQMTIEEE